MSIDVDGTECVVIGDWIGLFSESAGCERNNRNAVAPWKSL
jgi:hypothetical protein